MVAKRKQGLTITKPIVFGSVSTFMGKRSAAEHSHSWMIYVRAEDGSDLSAFVSKIVFVLHPSCSEPTVICSEPPYRVSQTGWGEFEAQITIHFKEELEKPVNGTHFLKLFHEKGSNTPPSVPVGTETYDEIVFHNPPDKLVAALHDTSKVDNTLDDIKEHFQTFSEDETLQSVQIAQEFITEELNHTLSEIKRLMKT